MEMGKINNEDIRTELQVDLVSTKVEDCAQKWEEDILLLLGGRVSKMPQN
jgi:hypothetical protein